MARAWKCLSTRLHPGIFGNLLGKDRMKHLVCFALLVLIPAAAFGANDASGTRVASIDELLGNARLIGHAVEIESCAGIPISDAPQDQNVIVVFRCGASESELMDDRKAVIGRISEATVLKPADREPVGNEPVFKGRFRGVLRRGTPEEDLGSVMVLDLTLVEIQSWVDDQPR